MRGLADLLRERLGVPAEDPVFRADDRFVWRPDPEEALVAPTALALALRGVLRPPVSRLNLRQEEFAYKRDLNVLRRRFLPTVSITGVLLLLALVNVGVIRVKDHRRIDKLDAQMAESSARPSLAAGSSIRSQMAPAFRRCSAARRRWASTAGT
jgi:hypothetical protein